MKTTVDLPATLLSEVRAAADKRGWTVRVVFEESLRAFLEREDVRSTPEPFRLAHTVIQGREFPAMSFAEMLGATSPDRWPAGESSEE
jgi:hypothetical protein